MARKNSKTPVQRRAPRRIPFLQLVTMFVAFIVVAVTGGVLAAGLAIPFAMGASATVDQGIDVFAEVPAELKPGPLSQASFVYAADGTELATFYAQNRIVVPLDQVSEPMQQAVIAIEDERFYEHGGIDPRGLFRAAINNAMGGDKQGASTLAQQYVKNILIDKAEQEGDPFGIIEAREDSVTRKLREAKLAVALDASMSKQDILQGYLNVAQFGLSVYGVETAANYYFSKSASDLTAVEAATIAGITKAPSQFDPTRNPEQSQARRNLVLNKMWSLGYISTADYTTAKETPVADTLHINPIEVGCEAAKGTAFFCDYVIKEIMTSPEFGETTEARRDLLYRGGLRITTTLDPKMQSAAERTVTEHVPADNSADLESVVTTIEPGTGKIKAMAQNIPYDPSANPKPGTTSVNYAADFRHGGSRGFQPGSTYKPFVLAEWLKSGHTLNQSVNSGKVTRTNAMFRSSCGKSTIPREGWSPANAEGIGGGAISVLKATYNSINTAYVDMATRLDLCSVANSAWDMGYRPTQKYTGEPLNHPTRDDVFITPSMVIGVQETSPLYMAAAFGTIASNGTYCSPIAITKVVTPDGSEMEVPNANCNPNALPSNVTATMTYALQHVISHGSGKGRDLPDGRPAAGKTGTSQLSAQTWFVGYTPQLATAVWVGEANGNPSHLNINFNGRRIHPMYGSSIAAPLWQAYMSQAVEGMEIV
ncbi:MAG: penicillin-binding protein, partial [Cellulomonadaceae bacterium]|nr:penicillin-binding protein [Cellulomonadaceae bacterium]